MPQLPRSFSAYPVSVTLDSNGNGAIRFQAVGSNIRLTNRSVRASSSVAQAIATTYKNQIGQDYRLDGTNSGSTGDSLSVPIDLFDGESVIVVWSGGDPGATATATFSGKQLPFDQVGLGEGGTNWASPIAAGDGSLIYPALKSPNFVTGVVGWQISRDGSAEFASGIFRGDVLIITPDRIISITGNSGVKVEDLVSPGGFAQLTTAPAYGGLINLQPIDSIIPLTTFEPSRIYTDADESFGDSRPYTVIQSPVIGGSPDLAYSRILVNSQAKLTAYDDSYIAFEADQLAVNGRFIGTGWYTGASTTGNVVGGAGSTTETLVLTVPSKTYKRGHAYRVEVNADAFISAGAPNRVLYRFRENWVNAGTPGLQIRATGIPFATNGAQHNADFSAVFTVSTAGDVTATISLTFTGTAAYTFTQIPTLIDIYDIGSNINHPNATVIT